LALPDVFGDQAVKQCLRTVGGITGASRKTATGLHEAYDRLHEAYKAGFAAGFVANHCWRTVTPTDCQI
jgi:hypothetical protein